MRVAGLIAASLWIAGCVSSGPPGAANDESGDSGSGEFVSLIDHDKWVQLDADADPLADHRPVYVECSSLAGWTILDDPALDVDTNYCNYLAVGQPSLAEITEGRRIRLGWYHFDLLAADPGVAHIAILVDGQILWEQEIEIPGDPKVPAELFNLEFEAPFSAPIGSEVVFHLHNHGQNTWVLQTLTAETP